MTVENTTNRSRVPNLSEEMSSSQSFQTAKGEMRETIQTSQGPTANQEGPSEEARIAELTQPRGLKAGQVLGQGREGVKMKLRDDGRGVEARKAALKEQLEDFAG